MGYQNVHPIASAVWQLARKQHDLVTHAQLLDLGFSAQSIKHRVKRGRLYPVYRGVYAVGRPRLTRHGEWMAAVLACGPEAVLSHESAAALWGIRTAAIWEIHVSVPMHVRRHREGIVVHRRSVAAGDCMRQHGIRITSPICTLVDLAAGLDTDGLEAGINEADIRGLCTPEKLRQALDEMARRPGRARLQKLLDRRTFRMTRSKLERRFLSIAQSAGLPRPLTRQWVNGFEVDFTWPELGLVVETDGLTYHRTPAAQLEDRLRDQTHTAAGLTCLRFTHYQIAYKPDHVQAILAAVGRRLSRRA